MGLNDNFLDSPLIRSRGCSRRTNPESGTITYSYDLDGNLLQKTSPAPNQTGTATQTVSYCYDALHRVTGKGYGAQTCPLTTPVVTYAYDSGTNAIGKLTSLTDQAGTATYTYDILGRLTAETRPIAGVSKSTSYTYNLDGSVKTLTYPSGRVVTYTPGAGGVLTSAVDGNGTQYVSSAAYYANGAENTRSMPGIFFSTTLNPRLQVSAFYSNNGTDAGIFVNKAYDYGAGHNNGNVMSITNYKDSNRTQTFTYDALNRITSGWSSANTGNYSWGENYSIDAWGNLQISPMNGKAHGGTFQLSGNAQNRPTGLAYDAAGNLMSYLSATYTYDQENRLSSTAGMSYTYDGNGERVLKFNTSTGAAVKRYWSMGGNTLAEGDGSGNLTAEYIYFGGKRIARIDLPANTVHYYLSDHLGSTSVVVSAAGALEEESDYYPFGTEVVVAGPGANELKFTGKRRDTESQLDYFGARYYSNVFGRFLTPDWAAKPAAVPYAELTDPQSLNLYTYVRDIPTSKVDADGHCADHYKDGSCKVNVDPKTGDAGVKAAKQLEGVLNKYDKAINALGDKSKFDIKDSKGNVIGSLSGKEIKAVWNGTSFSVVSEHFANGGAGGGTGGTWNGSSFSGSSKLTVGAVATYVDSAENHGRDSFVGVSTLTFHELAHETHFGEELTKKYPVGPIISNEREEGTSSAGKRMAETVDAPFICSMAGGCQ